MAQAAYRSYHLTGRSIERQSAAMTSRVHRERARSPRARGSPAAASGSMPRGREVHDRAAALRSVLRRAENARRSRSSSIFSGCRAAAPGARRADSTFGGGRNAPLRDVEQLLHREARLQHHRQPPVVRRRRRRDHALDHLLLQHEVHVAHPLGVAREVEQQRRRDVVRQVADHAHAGGQRAKSNSSASACVHRQPRRESRASRAARSRSISIDLQLLARARKQRRGERAVARADLDQDRRGAGAIASTMRSSTPRVVQEVLAEPLTTARCELDGKLDAPRARLPRGRRGRCRRGRAPCRGRPRCARSAGRA